MRCAHCYVGAATLFRDRERDVIAQLVVGDSKNTITLARSSADVSPPYGLMLLPGTTSSGFAMKQSSFSLSHTKSVPFMHGAGIAVVRERASFPSDDVVQVRAQPIVAFL